MLFAFICLSLGRSINIIFDKKSHEELSNASSYFNSIMSNIFNDKLMRIEILDTENSDFANASQFLKNYNIFDYVGNLSSDIFVPWKISYIKFLIDFIDDNISDLNLLQNNDYIESKYLKIFDEFVDGEINSQSFDKTHDNIGCVINYLIQVFDYFYFDSEKITLRFYNMIFSYIKSRDFENLEWLSMDWNSINFVLVNFSRVLQYYEMDFEGWSDLLIEYYDSIVFYFLDKKEQNNYEGGFYEDKSRKYLDELHLSKKLKRISSILDDISKYTIVKCIYIHDYYSYDKISEINGINQPIFIDNIKKVDRLDVNNRVTNPLFTNVEYLHFSLRSNEEINIDDLKNYNLGYCFPNLSYFYFKTSRYNEETIIDILGEFPLNLKEIHINGIRFSLDKIDQILQRYETINYTTIELESSRQIDLKRYLDTIRRYTQGNLNRIYINLNIFSKFDFKLLIKYIRLFENIEYLVLIRDDKISEDIFEMYKDMRKISWCKEKLKCLIQMVPAHFYLYECQFRFFSDDFDLEIFSNFLRNYNFKIIMFDNINLKNPVVNEFIGRMKIRELIIRNSTIPTISFMNSLNESLLGYLVNRIYFENVKFENINSLINLANIYLGYLVFKNVTFEGSLGFSNLNCQKYYISDIFIKSSNISEDDLKKFVGLVNIQKSICLIKTDLMPKQLRNIFVGDGCYEMLSYRPKSILKKENFYELDQIKAFKNFSVGNYDQEFESQVRKANRENTDGNVKYSLSGFSSAGGEVF